eukprot:4943558-Prymnesium_polylepis.1
MSGTEASHKCTLRSCVQPEVRVQAQPSYRLRDPAVWSQFASMIAYNRHDGVVLPAAAPRARLCRITLFAVPPQT